MQPVIQSGFRMAAFSSRNGQIDSSSNISVLAAPKKSPFQKKRMRDYPLSWSTDGQYIVFQRNTAETLSDLWILPLFGVRKPYPYLNTPIAEFGGRISPDGHWVAYAATESGHNEVFIQSFPKPGNKIRISSSGGQMPMWRKDGRELYFMADDGAIMAVNLTGGSSSVQASAPVRLFQTQLSPSSTSPDRAIYGASADGQRFLFTLRLENDRPQGIHIIHNWKPSPDGLTSKRR